jgi:hypothetical protein
MAAYLELKPWISLEPFQDSRSVSALTKGESNPTSHEILQQKAFMDELDVLSKNHKKGGFEFARSHKQTKRLKAAKLKRRVELTHRRKISRPDRNDAMRGDCAATALECCLPSNHT